MSDYQSILQGIKAYNRRYMATEDTKFGEPVLVDETISSEDIQEIERRLGTNFCSEYREFLLTIGCISCFRGHLTGCRRDSEGVVCCGVDEAKRYAVDLMGRDLPNSGCTVFEITDDQEWFVFIDHATGKIINYDLFAEEFIYTSETVYDYVKRFCDDIQ